MRLQPIQKLSTHDVERSMKLVIADGLAAEVMTTLTGGTFLVALALLWGATNIEIGILAALPTFTNVFQLISVWLVRRTNNRKAVTFVCSLLARTPLIIIGALPLLVPGIGNIKFLITFLFFFYFFGSLAGPSWNAWMKDLIPESIMGKYFARRSSYTQGLNVVLSLVTALTVDHIRTSYPQYELYMYYGMFVLAGITGIVGAIALAGACEMQTYMDKENIFRLLLRPFKDNNFVRLLFFNCAWVFAVNLATPFFTVFLMKGMLLTLSQITVLNILSQLASILTIRIWGVFADRYSNKTIIAIGAPLYILCLIAWCFVGIYSHLYANLILLGCIYICMGVSNAGINLSITNIGLKLAPNRDAVVYLSTRNMITAVFSALAPLVGGILADFFGERNLQVNAIFTGPHSTKTLHLIALHQWNFLFLIGAGLAIVALELLFLIKETGEVDKNIVVRIMRSSIKSSLKDAFIIGNIMTWHRQFWGLIRRRG